MEPCYRLYNADGKSIIFWIVGGSEDVSFLLKFLMKRLINLKENKEQREAEGNLKLGNRVYGIIIKTLTFAEWELIEKESLVADIVCFYQTGDVTSSSQWDEQKYWLCWGKVKALVFLAASICPGECYLLEKNLSDVLMEEKIDLILENAQWAKPKYVRKNMSSRQF
jgi:hypothetical protein